LEEKIGVRARFAGNSATRRGTALEPQARAIYEKHKNYSFVPSILQSKFRKWQAASVDGIDEKNSTIVEIKCGIKSYQFTEKTGKIPSYYFGQVQHILAVTGHSSLDYFSYLPGREAILLKVLRDEAYIEKLIKAEEAFCYQLIQNGAEIAGLSSNKSFTKSTVNSTKSKSQYRDTYEKANNASQSSNNKYSTAENEKSIDPKLPSKDQFNKEKIVKACRKCKQQVRFTNVTGWITCPKCSHKWLNEKA
jgi:putative phage-type endonuclease